MKLFSNLRNRLRKNLANNEKGQGATEYILLLVVVVGLVLAFKGKIVGKFNEATDKLGTDMGTATSDQ